MGLALGLKTCLAAQPHRSWLVPLHGSHLAQQRLFQGSLGCPEAWNAMSPRNPAESPGRLSGGTSLHYSFCFLAETAVAEGLQHLESKVLLLLSSSSSSSSSMLSRSQLYSGKVQNSQEKVTPPLWEILQDTKKILTS